MTLKASITLAFFIWSHSVSSFRNVSKNFKLILPTLLLFATSVSTSAQSAALTDTGTSGVPDVVQRRIEHARALAAAHQLQPAAVELENVRASVSDRTLKNVTTLMLIGIYLEQGTYVRAQALLEESFQVRASQKDESLRNYFATAGQAIIGLRSHLDRYRAWGISTGDTDLPPEVVADLDRVRTFLERLVAQAKDIAKEEGRAYDALALQEDVLGIRLSLAKGDDDRDKWQTEYVSAREKLASIQGPVASLTRNPGLGSVTSKIPNPFSTPKSSSNDDGDNGGNSDSAAESSDNSSKSSPNGQSSSTGSATLAGPSTTVNAPEPQLVSTGSLNGRESQRFTPAYPQMAKNAGITGTVRVFGIVDEKGKLWVTNSEGPTLLRRAAEDAARRWTFPPTVVSGKLVRLAGYLDFDFKP